ncbi:MAG: tetratricopeptide repeat protein [Gammaproteobacteria bacterium]|nr:tetratricopeptide repeat protein [Gammaproteobacteria bacterium]
MTRNRFFIHFLFIFIFGSEIAVADERLDVLKRISAAGAPALTLKMLDQAQPKIDEDLYEWILWEQERYKILSGWQQWNRLLVKIESLPVDIPDQFKHQTITYKAQAYLELGQTATARKIIREQLWQSGVGAIADYQAWRRLVISSYLKDGRIEDARISMLRYDQDFDSRDESWLLLRATVLIQTGRYEQAIQVLEQQKSWQSKSISLLARFRSDRIGQTELWKLVKTQTAKDNATADQLATLWALGVFASEKMSPVDRVVALEQHFKNALVSPLSLFELEADQLWRSYHDYARLVGNRSELLVGDHDKWLDLANNAAVSTPVKARSLYALLMTESRSEEVVNRAASGYLKTFKEIDESERILLNHLFNRSNIFADANQIPPIMRYQLVDLALKKADIDEATRLMSGMTSYPEGTSRLSWQLRQSRVLILGGKYKEGNQIMQALITEYKEPNVDDTDRILQVLFDMQTVNLHEEVINHFNHLLRLGVEPRQHREILFWIADSYKGLKKYDQAALLYFQSAMLPDPKAMDPWAQTARFNAAESLQKSGMVDDARRIYQNLLDNTLEPARRSLLKHNIQQLWLNQNTQ